MFRLGAVLFLLAATAASQDVHYPGVYRPPPTHPDHAGPRDAWTHPAERRGADADVLPPPGSSATATAQRSLLTSPVGGRRLGSSSSSSAPPRDAPGFVLSDVAYLHNFDQCYPVCAARTAKTVCTHECGLAAADAVYEACYAQTWQDCVNGNAGRPKGVKCGWCGPTKFYDERGWSCARLDALQGTGNAGPQHALCDPAGVCTDAASCEKVYARFPLNPTAAAINPVTSTFDPLWDLKCLNGGTLKWHYAKNESTMAGAMGAGGFNYGRVDCNCAPGWGGATCAACRDDAVCAGYAGLP